MPLPKLSPLQSRLAASLIASCMLLLLYLTFSSSHFAYAADVDSIRPEDHNHERLLVTPYLEDYLGDMDEAYVPDFLGLDRGIIGRQVANADDPSELENNKVVMTNVNQGSLMSYVFTNTSLWKEKSPVTPGLPSPIELIARSSKETENNDIPTDDNSQQGQEIKLQTRQSLARNRTLYITVTTCLQPSPIKNTTLNPPPQLRLYVSESQNNTKPGPTQNPRTQVQIVLQEGYGMYALNATGDVFIGVFGDNTTEYKDVWNAHIAASIDAPYHTYHNITDPNLWMVDSDSSSALFATDPLLTEKHNTTELYESWMNLTPPFVLFASPVNDSNLKGLERSFCAWNEHAQIGASIVGDVSRNTVQRGMTSRGVTNLPRQQFFMEGLQPGASYQAILAMKGNSTDEGNIVGGGGQVFPSMNFSTMQDGNCGVIYNLSFCTDNAYAVPSNPNIFQNMSSLAAFYDNYTQSYYENFKKVLAQTPCETTSSAKYSLARTCEDCEVAYKKWLCSVTIPRCTDFSSEKKPWTIARALSQPFTNGSFVGDDLRQNASAFMRTSRNPMIDTQVIPGPYREILPCDDLCYNVVQSCPASMGFMCPLPGDLGFNHSYGLRPEGDPGIVSKSTNITCNYPGASYFLAAGGRSSPSTALLAGLMMVVMAVIYS